MTGSHVVVDAFGCKVVAMAQNDKHCFGPFWALYRARHLVSSLGTEICEPRLIDLCTLARVTWFQGSVVPWWARVKAHFFRSCSSNSCLGFFQRAPPPAAFLRSHADEGRKPNMKLDVESTTVDGHKVFIQFACNSAKIKAGTLLTIPAKKAVAGKGVKRPRDAD